MGEAPNDYVDGVVSVGWVWDEERQGIALQSGGPIPWDL